MDGLIAYVLSKGYTDTRISELGSVLKFKGVKDHVSELPTTGNTVGDVWLIREDGSEYVWISELRWELLGSALGAGKYTTVIQGDGSTTTFTITHNLNTRDTAVLVYGESDYEETIVNITHTTVNTTTLVFNTAPVVGENYIVTCIVPQGPQGPKGDDGTPGKVQDVTVDGVSVVVEATGVAEIPATYTVTIDM